MNKVAGSPQRQYDYGFQFDSVVVIQSLRPGEFPTGWRLYQDTVLPQSTISGRLECDFICVRRASELLARLDLLAFATKAGGKSPIVHFEMHGSELGLELASGDVVEWVELTAVLSRINIASRFNLLVTFATCYGSAFVNAVSITRPAPVHMFIGPSALVDPVRIGKAFDGFYHTLLSTQDGALAWSVLRQALFGEVALVPALFFFRVGFSGYLKESRQPGVLAGRVRSFRRQLPRDLPSHQVGDILHGYVREIGNHQRSFDRCKRAFFMFDEFPDNEARYSLSMDDVDPQ